MTHEDHSAAVHDHEEHVSSYGSLGVVLGILLVLTLVTVWASRIDLGELHALHIWLSLAIASTKGILVLWYFMHLKFEPAFIRWCFIATLVVLVGMIGLTFADYLFR